MIGDIPHSRPWISEDDRKAVRRQLEFGLVATGAATQAWALALKASLRATVAVPAATGAQALEILLRAHELNPQDEVILPSYVCASVANAIRSAGATPVFADVGPGWVLTPDSVRVRVTPRTRFVVLVHLFGIDAWDDGFDALDIPIIEDCCQSFGWIAPTAQHRRASVARFYSFHATKCLTTGEGGAIVTSQSDVHDRVAVLRERAPHLFAFSDLQAALGLSQLSRYDEMLQRRQQIASRYLEQLPLKFTSGVRDAATRSMFFRFPLTVPPGELISVSSRCEASGVQVRRGVDALLHQRWASSGQFDQSEARLSTTLSIPIYPSLSDADVDRVLDVVGSALAHL